MKSVVPIPVQFIKCEATQVIINLVKEGKQQEISANDFVRKIEEGKFELVG